MRSPLDFSRVAIALKTNFGQSLDRTLTESFWGLDSLTVQLAFLEIAFPYKTVR